MKILVIEDDKDLRNLYQSFLQGSGHQLELAEDGWEGFKEGGTGEYDLIISDLNMPNWDGATSLESIVEFSPDIKIIVVTGFGDSEMAQDVQRIEQVKAIYTKPLNFKELLAKVEALASE